MLSVRIVFVGYTNDSSGVTWAQFRLSNTSDRTICGIGFAPQRREGIHWSTDVKPFHMTTIEVDAGKNCVDRVPAPMTSEA